MEIKDLFKDMIESGNILFRFSPLLFIYAYVDWKLEPRGGGYRSHDMFRSVSVEFSSTVLF